MHVLQFERPMNAVRVAKVLREGNLTDLCR